MEITAEDFKEYFEDTETQKLSTKVLKYFKNSKFDGMKIIIKLIIISQTLIFQIWNFMKLWEKLFRKFFIIIT